MPGLLIRLPMADNDVSGLRNTNLRHPFRPLNRRLPYLERRDQHRFLSDRRLPRDSPC